MRKEYKCWRKELECKICGTELKNETFIIDNVPEYTFNFSAKIITLKIIECPDCGLAQLVDVPESDNLANDRSIGTTQVFREKKKRQLRRIINKYDLWRDKFLEIGCGNGQYLDILKEIGITGEGIEQGETNSKECRAKGYIVNEPYGKLYNTICVFYFLEHQNNPLQFIESLNKSLDYGGYVIIDVPNYDYIKRHKLWLEFAREHRTYFGLKSLRKLLELEGLKIRKVISKDICLSVIAQKAGKRSLNGVYKKMIQDIDKFNKLVEGFSEYAIVGAGHYTQLLLNQIKKKPKYVFDSVPAKIGQNLCGITIRHQADLKSTDVNDVIISCGMYNKEALNNVKDLNRNFILWE